MPNLCCALRDNNDTKIRSCEIACSNLVCHSLSRKRNLRNQDDICAARYSRVQGDPTSMTAHHLQDHHSIMRLGSCVKSVESFSSNVQRGNETEGQFSARHIVIDCLRHAANWHSTLIELRGDRQSTLATEHNQRVDAKDRKSTRLNSSHRR